MIIYFKTENIGTGPDTLWNGVFKLFVMNKPY